MTAEEDLGGPLLRSVSRSFYLTIRILPGRLRAPIGLAYLLARISDTIADSAAAPAEVRQRHLAGFGEMVCRASPNGVAFLQKEIVPPDASERALIDKLPACLEWLARIAENDRAEIRSVMDKIIRGQSLDLERFPESGTGAVSALENAAQLEEYTYLVAGCVGEFWTRVCLHALPRYSAIESAELCRIGVNYGKGLQLVNILRDLPADLRNGRCYLPGDELRSAGAAPDRLRTEPALARTVFARWHARAMDLLGDGARYVAAIRPARIRIGCFIPWYLGKETLGLVAKISPLNSQTRLKVPRSTVRRALLLAPVVACSNLPLGSAGDHRSNRS